MPMDVVAYGCTSGAVVIGEENVFKRIREARPDAKCTTPITGAILGLKALKAKRIALLTPYIDSVNRKLKAYIEARGIEVPVIGCFNHENDNDVARISTNRSMTRRWNWAGIPRSMASSSPAHPCAWPRSPSALENELGKPVTSSNHAMAWHCLAPRWNHRADRRQWAFRI